ncbi:MAG: AmmeMemoRadiSam system protein A [Bacteroidales bacterium]|nr:AmmeMemoRadiSam system protein A [Bacteroidales bacterium]MCF8390790.1 AmmeMemoRadiSam system protein A [Bacteroidales bacterium]
MDQNYTDFLSEAEKQKLLEISRESLIHFLKFGSSMENSDKNISENLRIKTGAFVSIYVKGKLRGCIGKLSADIPLFELIRRMTISAASTDRRFKSLKYSELDNVKIELSVLTPMKRIYDISEFELGRHGIYISDGYNSGTFLPQVAEHSDWTKEEFLGHCSRDKARIGWDGWKTAELYIYEAIILKEK